MSICANCFVWFSRETLAEPDRSMPRKPCRNPDGPCDGPPRGTHILHNGKALCGFTKEPPFRWPRGNAWVAVEEREAATCDGCLAAYGAWEALRDLLRPEER